MRRRGGFWRHRLGADALQEGLLDRPVPAEVGWLHALGSVALVLAAVLVGTGVLLAFNYSPSTEHAYHSVRHIENSVPLGGLVRGLHHWAASLLVAVLVVHTLHAFARGGFAPPREVTWGVGALLFLVVLAFAFTGTLLPWDEKAYWATVVGTSMVAQFPGLGGYLLHLVRGGAEVGAATLARFYAIHVALLPLVLVGLVALHLYFVVLHGVTAREGGGRRKAIPFWPRVAAMDAVAMVVALTLLVALALWMGAPLEAPADPTNTLYVPRPEWYFLPLFELLTFFPGRGESIAVIAIPLVAGIAVLALPWWGAPLLRTRRGRASVLAAGGLAVGALIVLGARGAARAGPELSGPPPAVARGRLLFDQLGCPNCHSIRGVGGIVGPDLTLVGFRRPDSLWLAAHLREPRSIVPASPMPDFPLEGAALDDVVAFLLSLGNDLRHTAEAPDLFRQHCLPCHRLAGEGGTYGPDLGRVGGIRTVAEIHEYVERPSALNPDARMPPALGLTHAQVEDLARYIQATALAEGTASTTGVARPR